MAAPFPLPDRATIFTAAGGTPVAEDVPCRQVPAYARTGNTQTTGPTPLYTHWVDFEVGTDVDDNAVMTYPRQVQSSPGYRLIIDTETSILVLIVLWVEDRFSNTDQAYIRAYCTRSDRLT